MESRAGTDPGPVPLSPSHPVGRCVHTLPLLHTEVLPLCLTVLLWPRSSCVQQSFWGQLEALTPSTPLLWVPCSKQELSGVWSHRRAAPGSALPTAPIDKHIDVPSQLDVHRRCPAPIRVLHRGSGQHGDGQRWAEGGRALINGAQVAATCHKPDGTCVGVSHPRSTKETRAARSGPPHR